MLRKIVGTIILIAVLALLGYNLFYRPTSAPQEEQEGSQNNEEQQEIPGAELVQEAINPVKTEERSDTAVKMGQNLDAFNEANSIVYEFIEAINTNEHQKAYDMLNPEYVKELGLPFEAFEQKYSYTTEKAFKAESLSTVQGGVMLTGFLIDYYGGEAQDTSNSFMPYTFTIFDSEPKTIADIGVISTEDIDKKYSINENTTISAYKQYKTSEGYIILAVIVNSGDKDTFIENSNYGIFATYGGNTYPHILINSIYTDYEILAGEVKHYKILFPKADIIDSIGIKFQDGTNLLLGVW